MPTAASAADALAITCCEPIARHYDGQHRRRPGQRQTITDHIAVLRPHAWLMLGHCAGLRNSQSLGDYVLAHGYVREDHVLDEELPLWVPIPALAEVQVALETAVADVTKLKGYRAEARAAYRYRRQHRQPQLGLLPSRGAATSPELRFSQSRAIALDMESATIAANGFRFRVPYGTLLCVSDKPLHGEINCPAWQPLLPRASEPAPADRHPRHRTDAPGRRRSPCTAASCGALLRWRSSRRGRQR